MMQRAGVFIGVAETGHLPRLQDALSSAERMYHWGLDQGMVEGESALLITDRDGPVTPDVVTGAVEQVLEAGPEQLIVYFAGHGVARLGGEVWLLSKAPENPNHAVDVRWSIDAACNGPVPHVVFISDACRTAPEGIQAQAVTGSSIFPNVQSARARFVDIYYACGLGRPALEIKDPQASAGSYRAVFTEVLMDVLSGRYADALIPSAEHPEAWLAECRKVRDCLTREVPRRLVARHLAARYGQEPEARIWSDPGAWLARVTDRSGAVPGGEDSGPPPPAEPPPEWLAEERPLEGLRVRGLGRGPVTDPVEHQLVQTDAPQVLRAVADTASVLDVDPGPDHLDTGCGVTVHGDHVEGVYSGGVEAEQQTSALLRITLREPAATVLLRLGSGAVAVVPVVAGFLTRLHLDQGELLSMAFEPSRIIPRLGNPPESVTSPRWKEFGPRAAQIRRLRALAAAASAHGRFQPRARGVRMIEQEMQYASSVDPALAIYAAYALYARRGADGPRGTQRIESMAERLHRDLGISFFDLELLSGRLRAATAPERVLPGVPLMSQGWSLVLSQGITLTGPLAEARRLAKDSLWSLFEPAALEALTDLLAWERGR